MTAETTKSKIRTLGSALLIAGLAFTGTASAISVNGNLDSPNEYAESKQIHWWNDHKSTYTFNRLPGNPGPGANDWETSVMNPLRYTITDTGGGKESLNLFFEVPNYARRMIWEDGCKVKASTGVASGCSSNMTDTQAKQDVLDAYAEGTHHDDADLKYGTQTESEYFRLNYSGSKPIDEEIHGNLDKDGKPKLPNTDDKGGGNPLVAIKWQAEDTVADNFTWKTSREYVIANNADCDTTKCFEFDKTAAIELEWIDLGSGVAASIVNSIANMQLHLSDEAHGIPDMSEVPVPAAFWLFGTALIGFIGYSRRTNLS